METVTATESKAKRNAKARAPRPPTAPATLPNKEDSIIKKLTIAYANWEETSMRHQSELSTISDVTGFLDFLGDSVTFEGLDIDIFDRGKGFLSWVQGMALSQVFPLPGAKNKKMELVNADGTRLAWTDWLRTLKHPISESTAYWYRRIHRTFSAAQAKTTGYTEMISQVSPSHKKAMNRDREKWKKHHELQDTNDGGSDGDKNEATPVGTVEKTLDKLARTLKQLQSVRDAPDLFNDIEGSLQVLEDQQKRIDVLRRALNDVEKALQDARESVIKYRDDGPTTAQRKAAQARAAKSGEK